MLNQLQGVFASLQKHDVRYVVIGGIAAVLHGVPRATFDLDILIEATRDNAQRLLNALLDAGLGTAALTTVDDVLAHEITVFRDRVRIARHRHRLRLQRLAAEARKLLDAADRGEGMTAEQLQPLREAVAEAEETLSST